VTARTARAEDAAVILTEPSGDAQRYDLRILNAIRQIIRAADIDSRKLAAQHQITSPQLMCLMAVVEKGPTTAVEIARRIHLSASTLVGILDRLEAKGLVDRERNADDRREIAVTPTTAGRDLVSKTPFPLQYSLAKALKQLSADEREQVAGCMERLVELMGAGDIDDGPMLEIVALGEGHSPEAAQNEHDPESGQTGTNH
jgi:DNA-binding MarR family transcriptional regulator